MLTGKEIFYEPLYFVKFPKEACVTMERTPTITPPIPLPLMNAVTYLPGKIDANPTAVPNWIAPETPFTKNVNFYFHQKPFFLAKDS